MVQGTVPPGFRSSFFKIKNYPLGEKPEDKKSRGIVPLRVRFMFFT
jgi:hypothetical protein